MQAMDADHARYRQLRGAWGWIILAAWVGFWVLGLNADLQTALARPCPPTLLQLFGDTLLGAGESCKAAIRSSFWGNIFLTTILALPLAFFLSPYIARWRLEKLVAAEQETARAQERTQRQAQQAAITHMGDKSRREEAAARQTNDRYEFITRLGAVDDQLIVLADETDPERIKLIKLNIMQAVRDIHAKFTDAELAALYREGSGIASRVERSLAEMRTLNLEGTRLYDDLASLFPVNTSPHRGEAGRGAEYGTASPAITSNSTIGN